jgi:hypothetical protein
VIQNSRFSILDIDILSDLSVHSDIVLHNNARWSHVTAAIWYTRVQQHMNVKIATKS